SSRALLSAAAAVGDDPQVHGRLRAARIAAARSHAGSRGRTSAGFVRGALHEPRRCGSEAMNRRAFLGLAALVPFAQALRRDPLPDAPGFAVGIDGNRVSGMIIARDADGLFSRSRIANSTNREVRLREVVLFDAPLTLPADTALYGEGFQMLTQTGG